MNDLTEQLARAAHNLLNALMDEREGFPKNLSYYPVRVETALRGIREALAAYNAVKDEGKSAAVQDVVKVPREPTEAMVHALCRECRVEDCKKCVESREHEHYGKVYPMCYGIVKECYAAMLAAAPAAPQVTEANIPTWAWRKAMTEPWTGHEYAEDVIDTIERRARELAGK